MTLGVLAPYRNHGIGTKLVQSVIDYIQNEKATPTSGKKINTIDEIKLHVQTSNTDAIQFYCTKFGFEKGELIENYYKRIDPPHCYILRKKL
jgi:ribosomal protein S18 acetylase RimI-like enzyme